MERDEKENVAAGTAAHMHRVAGVMGARGGDGEGNNCLKWPGAL